MDMSFSSSFSSFLQLLASSIRPHKQSKAFSISISVLITDLHNSALALSRLYGRLYNFFHNVKCPRMSKTDWCMGSSGNVGKGRLARCLS